MFKRLYGNRKQSIIIAELIIVCWSGLLWMNVGQAATGAESLKQFFHQLKTFRADFTQSVQGAQLSVVDRSSGTLVIQRPGQFHWHYTQPYLQQIVADGTKIWIYDADLEQVTIKPYNETLGNTPALLLSENRPLEETFNFEELAPHNNLSWVALTPKDAAVSFTKIRLGFADNLLQSMELMDNLGQRTTLTFTNIQRNTPVDNGVFTLQVPAGADVFDTRQPAPVISPMPFTQ